MKLGIKKLSENATIPKYQTSGAAGFDLTSVENKVIPAGGYGLVSTGLAFEIPEGYEVQIRSRSGLALKHGIQAHFGTIDSDYTGNVGVILYNHSSLPFKVAVGDRIAQAIVAPVVQAQIVEVDTLKETERGSGGFGSTGIKG
jgi:dUTP pyrophosphatase